jgi:hypothetical protein
MDATMGPLSQLEFLRKRSGGCEAGAVLRHEMDVKRPPGSSTEKKKSQGFG